MEKQTFLIELEDISSAEANRSASELRDILLDASRDIKAELKRSDENTQDFGSTIVLVLGAPAVIVAAKALGDYLKLRRSAKIRIKSSTGEVIGSGLTSHDAKAIVQMLQEPR